MSPELRAVGSEEKAVARPEKGGKKKDAVEDNRGDFKEYMAQKPAAAKSLGTFADLFKEKVKKKQGSPQVLVFAAASFC